MNDHKTAASKRGIFSCVLRLPFCNRSCGTAVFFGPFETPRCFSGLEGCGVKTFPKEFVEQFVVGEAVAFLQFADAQVGDQ